MIPGQTRASDPNRGYTTADVARRLGVSANHVRTMIAAKKIHAQDVGTTRVEYRISEAEVERLLAARTAGRMERLLQFGRPLRHVQTERP